MGIQREVQERFGKITDYALDTYPSSFAYGLNDIKTWGADKISQSYPYQQGLHDAIWPLYGPGAEVWKAVEDFHNGIKSNNLTDMQVVKYLSLTNNELGAFLTNYLTQTVEEWQKSLGYEKGTFVRIGDVNAYNMALSTQGKMTEFLEALGKLGEPAQKATANLSAVASSLRNLATGFIWDSDHGAKPAVAAAKDGAIEKVGGISYKYDASKDEWQQIGPDGQAVKTTVPLANQQFQSFKQSVKEGNNSPTGGVTGVDQSQYKSHYNNNNAAPKQIIVKIDNLMSVGSIDLSNPNNAAVIADLKSQLTQTLVDVVHDFDETFHG
jgi:hypothetical protein